MPRPRKLKPPPSPQSSPYNPRKVTKSAQAGLAASMRTFGDLSGFVLNSASSRVICGHQRRIALPTFDELYAAVRWGAPYSAELGHARARFTSEEREGTIVTGSGARFRLRLVDWPEPFEKAANVAANSGALAGTFTPDLAALLDEIRSGMIASGAPDAYGALLMDELAAEAAAGAEPDVVAIKVEKPPVMTWVLLGVPTVKYGKIAATIAELAKDKDVLCEITAASAEEETTT